MYTIQIIGISRYFFFALQAVNNRYCLKNRLNDGQSAMFLSVIISFNLIPLLK